MTVVPIRSEFSKIEGLSQRIAIRAADLMRVLGENGRMALVKGDVKRLMRYMNGRQSADGGTYYAFVALESELRQRHGLVVRALAVAAHGVVRAERDPSHRNTPGAVAREMEARKAAKAQLVPQVANDRAWKVPKARPSGPNVIDFSAWAKKRRRIRYAGGHGGPQAA